MNRVESRLLCAGFLTLLLHASGLLLPLFPGQNILPTPLPVQSISVSLQMIKGRVKPTFETEQVKTSPPLKKRVEAATKEVKASQRPSEQKSPEQQKIQEPPTIATDEKQVVEEPERLPPPVEELEVPSKDRISREVVASSVRSSSENDNAQVMQKATPLYRINPPPKYPRLARRRGLEGQVLINVLVDTSGRVVELETLSSCGHSILDRAALDAVRRWHFIPGNIDGKKQQMWVKVPVRFQLQTEEGS